MSISVEHLSFAYPGAVWALDDVSATAEPGRITVMIGPNAAGKSTLLRCLIGSLKPDRGHTLIDGRPAHQLRTHALCRRIAYVPQRPSVAAAFTVRQVVQLGRYALERDPKRIDTALGAMDLESIADRPFPALSVGQQQRVTLARALAQVAPEGHLILDEPTSAMDLRHVRVALEVLQRQAATGVTVIMAVHDLALAGSIAHEAWLMDEGRMVACGPAADVLMPDRLEGVFGVPFEMVEGRLLVRDPKDPRMT